MIAGWKQGIRMLGAGKEREGVVFFLSREKRTKRTLCWVRMVLCFDVDWCVERCGWFVGEERKKKKTVLRKGLSQGKTMVA